MGSKIKNQIGHHRAPTNTGGREGNVPVVAKPILMLGLRWAYVGPDQRNLFQFSLGAFLASAVVCITPCQQLLADAQVIPKPQHLIVGISNMTFFVAADKIIRFATFAPHK